MISSCYQTPLDIADRETASSLSDQLHSESARWDKPLSSHNTEKGMHFFWCGRLQSMPICYRCVVLLVSGTRKRTSQMVSCGNPVSPWEIPRPAVETRSWRIAGGIWIGNDCHFDLRLKFTHSDNTQSNMIGTNAAHCSCCIWKNLKRWLWQGKQTVDHKKLSEGRERSFLYCQETSLEIDINCYDM